MARRKGRWQRNRNKQCLEAGVTTEQKRFIERAAILRGTPVSAAHTSNLTSRFSLPCLRLAS